MNKLEQTMVKDVYEKIAHHYNNTRVFTWDWITDFINSLPKNSLIYDVGCGNGRNMLFPNHNFIGIDNCHKFLEICKSKNLNVIEANITKIPLKSNSANAIICIATFHHLSNKINCVNCLLELKRLINQDGKILLSVWSKTQPAKTNRHFKNYGHTIVTWNKYGEIYERYYYIFNLDELYQLFKIAGLYVKSYQCNCGNEIFILIKI